MQKFLKLKEGGVHFNARLAQSEGLRNPSLFGELVGWAGVDEGEGAEGDGEDKAERVGVEGRGEERDEGQGAGQYTTTLPEALRPVSSAGFPQWAYCEELNKSQAEITRWREKERRDGGGREHLEFVAARERGRGTSTAGSKTSSRTGSAVNTPGSAKDGGRRLGSRSPKRRRER